jgi:hypothetical protein
VDTTLTALAWRPSQAREPALDQLPVSRNPPAAGNFRADLALSGKRQRTGNQLFTETLRLIALIEEASVIERILRHLRLPTDVPTPRPGRAPPLDVAWGALSRVEGRRFSRPASLTKTFTSRPSPPTSDRRAGLGSPEVCPPSSGAPRSATSSLTRRRQRRQ